MGETSLRGRRTGASLLPPIPCQIENGKMRQKHNNAVEGWHHPIKGSLGYVRPTIFKFTDFLRLEQSAAAENRLICLQVGKKFPKNECPEK